MEACPPILLNRCRSSVCYSAIPRITNKRTKKANPNTDRRPPQQLRRTLQSSLPYPKPTPTPVLTTNPTAAAPPRTRDQHLDAILRDVETSISRGVSIDSSTFSSLLEACYQTGSFDRTARLHGLIPPDLLRRSSGLTAKLLRLYAARGDVDEAQQLFDEMRPADRGKDAFAWNALIAGYADRGDHEDAMALYYQMEEDGVPPDQFTFPRVLKACAGIGSVALGEAVHREAVRRGFGMDSYVMNALVDMYAKCGDIAKARRVFDVISLDCRDVVSWNSMIVGYARHGLYLEAAGVFGDMVWSGSEPPDSVAVSSILSALPPASRFAAEIHGWALRSGLVLNMSVANALITMYSEQGRPELARAIFDAMGNKDVVSWNAIISAYRRDARALSLFRQMQEGDAGVSPDQVTFVSLLSTCADMGWVREGQVLFDIMMERYKIEPGMGHYSCMVNLLGRAGLVEEAYRIVSHKMPFDGGPTVWGALLYACSLHGNVGVGEVAAERLFDLEPDNGHNFQLLMEVYRKVGRPEDMEKVRKMMTDRGLGC